MRIKFLNAFNGDAIWISFLENETRRNIIIDGGTGDTYINRHRKKGHLFEVIENLRNDNQFIDLLILTHFDDDHIGGLLRWMNKDELAPQLIKKVWFNSGKKIAEEFSLDLNPDLEIQIKKGEENFYTSTKQGIKFEEYLEKNKLWDGKIIKQGDEIQCFELNFKILSPNIWKLENLGQLYKKEKDYFTTGEEFDFNTNLINFCQEEQDPDFKFKEDKSVPNGSSIAFILQKDDRKFLFLGDSHPSVIIEGLNHFKVNQDKNWNVDLMKVSHHGSMYNTNKELLELVKTNNYLISSNATKHGLPNKRTIARIINNNPNANIYFNYDLKDKIFSEQDWKDYQSSFSSKLQNEF